MVVAIANEPMRLPPACRYWPLVQFIAIHVPRWL